MCPKYDTCPMRKAVHFDGNMTIRLQTYHICDGGVHRFEQGPATAVPPIETAAILLRAAAGLAPARAGIGASDAPLPQFA